MPVNQSIWKVGNTPEELLISSLTDENELEEMICNDVRILDDNWLLVGHQVPTAHGGSIDVLAINENGTLIVVELKKNRTPRDVVAQAVDYASWVKTIDLAKVASIYEDPRNKLKSKSESLDQALSKRFNRQFTDEEIKGAHHQIVIVASELDPSTERIVKYLSDFEIPINTLFFKVFKDGESRYISRSWFMDPIETQEHANLPGDSSQKVPWNSEYYVSFGHELGRNWEDARNYGFISAGGKPWYSQTLDQLVEGDRVWVNIPRTGYVGVGIVEEPVTIAKDFKVKTAKGMMPIIDAPLALDKKDREGYLIKYADNEKRAEYFVRVKWIRSFPIEQAVKQLGFFGNQNSVCKPRTPSWVFTIDTLKKKWGVK